MQFTFKRLFNIFLYQRKRHALWIYLCSLVSRHIDPFVEVMQDGNIFVVPSNDHVMLRHITLHYDNIDPLNEYIDFVDARSTPGAQGGGTFIDVGANFGTTSIRAARHTTVSRVIAFEPSAFNQQVLQRNIELNGMTGSIYVIAKAASEVSGTGVLTLSEKYPGDHRMMPPDDVDLSRFGDQLGRKIETVKTMRLDDLDPEVIASVGYLWIDAQGHETQILRGASKILARKIPILMEFSPYHLRCQGGLNDLFEIAGRSFTSFIDMGAGKDRTSRPVTDLAKLAVAYDRDSPHYFTDILLF